MFAKILILSVFFVPLITFAEGAHSLQAQERYRSDQVATENHGEDSDRAEVSNEEGESYQIDDPPLIQDIERSLDSVSRLNSPKQETGEEP